MLKLPMLTVWTQATELTSLGLNIFALPSTFDALLLCGLGETLLFTLQNPAAFTMGKSLAWWWEDQALESDHSEFMRHSSSQLAGVMVGTGLKPISSSVRQ